MAKSIIKPRVIIQPTRPVAVKAAQKQIVKPQPKGNSKQTVNNPSSFINGAPIIYKQPPVPKIPKAIGKQQAMTQTGIINKLEKNKQGDLVNRANPNAISIPAKGITLKQVHRDFAANEIPLKDGSVVRFPIKKRTY